MGWNIKDIFIYICIFLAFIIEVKNVRNYIGGEKVATFFIAISYMIELVMFILPVDNIVVEIVCTVFGITLLVCLLYRWMIRKSSI